MLRDYLVLALKSLRHQRLRSYLTMLGIVIGITAIISLISLGDALKESITGQFSSLGTDKLVVGNVEAGFGPPGSTAAKKLNRHDLKIIEETNGVEEAIVRLIRIVGLELDGKRDFFYVTSVPEDEKEISIVIESLDLNIVKGRFLKADDNNKIVVGSHIDEDHFKGNLVTGEKIKVQDKDFEIVGTIGKSSSFQINTIIFMPEKDLVELLNIGDEIDLIVVKVEDEKRITEVAKLIEKRLRKDRDLKEGEEDFSVQTPLQSIESVNTILNIVNLVFGGIAAISLLVGGIGIANTMFTSVLERKKQIGIMKSIGAKNSDVLKIFVFESALLGLLGGLIGAIFGVALAFTTSSFIENSIGLLSFKIKISFPLITLAILFSSLIGIISGILPAIRASKLNPVSALRQ